MRWGRVVRWGKIAIAAVAFAGLSCDIGAPERVSAPTNGELHFRYAGPNRAAILLPVFINGQGPFNLILDTGATLTCLNEGLVDAIGLPHETVARGIGVTVVGVGAVRLAHLDSLRVGAAQAYGISACILDLNGMRITGRQVDGLLGLNFLKAFRVTLDFDRETVRLQPQ